MVSWLKCWQSKCRGSNLSQSCVTSTTQCEATVVSMWIFQPNFAEHPHFDSSVRRSWKGTRRADYFYLWSTSYRIKKKRRAVGALSMDIQNERRRLLDSEDGHDPTGLISEQDAYLRLVNIHRCCSSSNPRVVFRVVHRKVLIHWNGRSHWLISKPKLSFFSRWFLFMEWSQRQCFLPSSS